jgi:hypothetical protein
LDIVGNVFFFPHRVLHNIESTTARMHASDCSACLPVIPSCLGHDNNYDLHVPIFNIRPDDISYIFSGYAPLSIRLVQHAVRSGW